MHLFALDEYGLRCLLQVALHDGNPPVTAAEIARRQGLGPEYVARIMGRLRAGGLVVSTRGAAGGYHLARPASAISVWEAIVALGGAFFPEGFCDEHPGQRRECIQTLDCSIRAIWRKTQSVLSEALQRISLADLRRNESSMEAWLDHELRSRPGVTTPRDSGEGFRA